MPFPLIPSTSPYQCTFNVFEERHHDFRYQLPNADPNGVHVSHDYHGFARLDRQRCCSVQFFNFHNAGSLVVEPVSPPRQFWCAEGIIGCVRERRENIIIIIVRNKRMETLLRSIIFFLGEDGEAKFEDCGRGGQLIIMKAFGGQIRLFFWDLRFQATCGNRDLKHAVKICRLIRTVTQSDVPNREYAGCPLGTMLALVAQVSVSRREACSGG